MEQDEKIESRVTLDLTRSMLTRLLLLCTVFALARLCLPPQAWGLIALYSGLSILPKLGYRTLERYPHFILGLALPTAPVFGGGTLLCCALIYCICYVNFRQLRPVAWYIPFFILPFTWIFWECHQLGGIGAGIAELTTLKTWSDIFSLQSVSQSPLLNPALDMLRLAVLLVVFLHFSKTERYEDKSTVERGLLFGLLIAVCISFIQIALPSQTGNYFTNWTAFWRDQGRYPGSFTDPNAFGICVALVLPWLLYFRQKRASRLESKIATFLLVSLAILVMYSGSRSFFLMVIVYVFAWLYWCRPTMLVGLCGAGVLFVLSVNIFVPSLQQTELWAQFVPSGVQRLVETLVLENAKNAFFSRFVFLQVGWAIWLDNFWLGVGWGGVYGIVPEYAAQLRIPTGLWMDNANNFYLGILAELGVVGGMAFLFMCCHLRWKSTELDLRKLPIIAMVIVLFLGPHLFFDEVAICFALIAASVIRVRHVDYSRGFSGAMWLFVIAGAIFIGLRTYTMERGMFHWEQNARGDYYRWTTDEALVRSVCVEGHTKLQLRAIHPDIDKAPVEIVANVLGGTVKKVAVNDVNIREIQLPCQSRKMYQGAKQNEDSLVRIAVSRTWQPIDYQMGSDTRNLGVQLFDAQRFAVQ